MNQLFTSLTNEFDSLENVRNMEDWNQLKAFNKWRHKNSSRIDDDDCKAEVVRVKERLKTVSVALVLCLNVGVDPPDVVKPNPSAKTECWIDPFSMPPYKAMEAIATNLQKQYEKYHPRARYKQAFDPKFEEVKKLCTSLRRSAKDDRVLFHYNGHGVPRPTVNGEIWVFNRDYTQYLPLSVYDLQSWMGANSVYVYDCSAAGEIIKNFNDFARRRGKEVELAMTTDPAMLNGYTINPSPDFVNCIQFAACASDQTLPMNPELPADLFTCCLTSPIKMSLKYYMLQQENRLLPHVTPDLIDRIPGLVTDRRTMLGELNWILTAIMDSIAWDILPMATFQRLFRQDLLISLLSRHFILAQRVMRSYDCTPQSWPEIPSAHNHPLWQTWDLAVDQCLAQLPAILSNTASNVPVTYTPSTFFTDQLTAFQVWLSYGARIQGELSPRVQQLPVVLQVLLSNVHRLRALELFSRFLSLGDWAVRMALAVGIFPYILKLLQSPDRELRPLLVCMWSKIFALDPSAQSDLLVDSGYLYFVMVLSDTSLSSEYRTKAAFVLANFVHNFSRGQDLAHQANLIATCLEQLNDSNPLLRQWVCLCLGLTWNNHRNARWCGVRDSAHEKLFDLLYDPMPDVRASAVYALGTFINAEKTDHANTIDHSIGMKLINAVGQDGSPLVRKELIQALQWLVLLFENQFVGAEVQCRDEEEKRKHSIKDDGLHFSPTDSIGMIVTPPSGALSIGKVASRERLMTRQSPIKDSKIHFYLDSSTPPSSNLIKRVSSSTSLSGYGSGMSNSSAIGNVFMSIWKQLLALCIDSHPEVAALANRIVNRVRSKITQQQCASIGSSQSTCFVPGSTSQTVGDILRESRSDPSFSEPSSPLVHSSYLTDSLQSTGHSGNHQNQRRERQTSESSSGPALQLTQQQHTSRRERQTSECNSSNIMTTSTIMNTAGSLTVHGSQGNLLPGQTGRERQSSEGSNSGHTRTLSSNSAQYNASMLTPFQRKRKIFGKEPPQEHGALETTRSEEQVLDARVEIINTRFIDWCIRQFNDYPFTLTRHADLESIHNQKREWRLLRNHSLQSAAREERCRIDFTRTDDVVFVQKNTQMPRLLQFHTYEPLLFVAERETCSVWSWDNQPQPTSLVQTINNCNLPNSRITGMQLLNEAETASIMLGCDDGSVKLWKLRRGPDGYGWRDTASSPKLVTAFNVFHQMIPNAKSPGTLLHWEQATGELIAAGDSKLIRIWDAHKEMKSKDLVLGSDNPLVTSIHSDRSHCIGVGCNDGSVRIYDKRLAMNESRVITFREHNSAIVNAHLFPDNEKHAYIISGSTSGDIKFWDKRSASRSIKTIQMPGNSNLTAMSFHSIAETFACATTANVINIYSLDGIPGSVIKHQGFMRTHLAPINCLAHHPIRIHLAMGCNDSIISVFTSAKSY